MDPFLHLLSLARIKRSADPSRNRLLASSYIYRDVTSGGVQISRWPWMPVQDVKMPTSCVFADKPAKVLSHARQLVTRYSVGGPRCLG